MVISWYNTRRTTLIARERRHKVIEESGVKNIQERRDDHADIQDKKGIIVKDIRSTIHEVPFYP